MVSLTGSKGNYELRFDKTKKATDTTVYLMAETKGLARSVVKYRFIVCASDCFQKTAAYHENLEFIVPKNIVRLGLASYSFVKPKSVFFDMVSFAGCVYCETSL